MSIFVLFGVAVATSQLTARVRAQADLAAASARINATLAAFLRQLTGTNDAAEAARIICDDVGRLFDGADVLFAPGPDGGLAIQAATSPDYKLDAMDLAAADWAFDTGSPPARAREP